MPLRTGKDRFFPASYLGSRVAEVNIGKLTDKVALVTGWASGAKQGSSLAIRLDEALR